MTEWQPLSERRGLREAREPQEGVPAHLERPLFDWLRASFGEDGHSGRAEKRAEALCLLLSIPVDYRGYQAGVTTYAALDQDLFLDVIDGVLKLGFAESSSTDLELRLKMGGSVWKVRDDRRGLIERVPVAEAEAYRQAISLADKASEDLEEAWNRAYGMARDPSDAWDHSIKAIEWLLKPVVTPDDTLPTLGKMLSALRAKPDKWELLLETTDREVTPVRTIIAMLGLVWGNPDRHGSESGRPPTQAEAEAIVRMAVTIVGLLRTGTLVLK